MMKSFMLSELALVCGGKLIGDDTCIKAIKTDSRKLEKGDLFVALVGDRFDAHDFIGDMKIEQLSAVLVSKKLDTVIPQILVEDTVIALGKVGEHNRDQFFGVLTGITGSCGKTTVKEMLACIYSMQGKVLATKGNLNNHLGVPLTLLELSQSDEFAVIEMGASGPGEIAYTTALSKPHIVIISNASAAHLEGFGSLQGIVNTKGEIIQGLDAQGIAILNADDDHIDSWKEMAKQVQVCTFGIAENADVRAVNISIDDHGYCRFDVQAYGQQHPVQLAVMGQHNVGNGLAAIAAALAAGMELTDIVAGLQDFDGVQGRLRPYEGIAGMQLIDDSYNANPASVMAAIDVLASQQAETVLVLGVMAELGTAELQAHQQVLDYALEKNIQKIVTLGGIYRVATETLKQKAQQITNFDDVDSLIEQLKANAHKQQVALIKGSRSAGMDVVVKALKGEIK